MVLLTEEDVLLIEQCSFRKIIMSRQGEELANINRFLLLKKAAVNPDLAIVAAHAAFEGWLIKQGAGQENFFISQVLKFLPPTCELAAPVGLNGKFNKSALTPVQELIVKICEYAALPSSRYNASWPKSYLGDQARLLVVEDLVKRKDFPAEAALEAMVNERTIPLPICPDERCQLTWAIKEIIKRMPLCSAKVGWIADVVLDVAFYNSRKAKEEGILQGHALNLLVECSRNSKDVLFKAIDKGQGILSQAYKKDDDPAKYAISLASAAFVVTILCEDFKLNSILRQATFNAVQKFVDPVFRHACSGEESSAALNQLRSALIVMTRSDPMFALMPGRSKNILPPLSILEKFSKEGYQEDISVQAKPLPYGF